MRCSAGAGVGVDSVGECGNAGEASVRARAGCVWKEDRALGSTMCVGTLGNSRIYSEEMQEQQGRRT